MTGKTTVGYIRTRDHDPERKGDYFMKLAEEVGEPVCKGGFAGRYKGYD